MTPKGNRALAVEFALGSDLNSASDHSVSQDWILDLTEEEICCSWSWGMARMPIEASEPPAATLPPLLPSSLAHLPPPTHPPRGRPGQPSLGRDGNQPLMAYQSDHSLGTSKKPRGAPQNSQTPSLNLIPKGLLF